MYRALKLIHRITGLIGALFIILISITGLLLNHKEFIGYSTPKAMKFQEFVFALHSGSIGNVSIVWLIDLGAICMIALSITGILISLQNRKGS